MTNFDYLMKFHEDEVKDALFRYVLDLNERGEYGWFLKDAVAKQFKNTTLEKQIKVCDIRCTKCESYTHDCGTHLIKDWLDNECTIDAKAAASIPLSDKIEYAPLYIGGRYYI